MMAMAFAGAKAGTLSWSLASSSVKAAGKRSDRVEKSCPTLMKVGPSFNRDSLYHVSSYKCNKGCQVIKQLLVLRELLIG